MSEPVVHYQRIVVKLGTRLVNSDETHFNTPMISGLAREMVEMTARGREFILVSSGAIGMGMRVLGWKKRPAALAEKQACAAIGQGHLMHCYHGVFGLLGKPVAQVLLTRDGLDVRSRYLHARNTLETLLSLGVVPIVNENDTVSTEELGFSDNDQLSALVACKMDADLLVLLSDVDGLYRDPQDPATLVPEITAVTPELVGLAKGARDHNSVGGMCTKLEAARTCLLAGLHAVIANGHRPGILTELVEGAGRGTWFRGNSCPLSSRKRWIAFGKTASGGRVVVDAGACRALVEEGRSLLPSGIVRVEGRFPSGQLVAVCDETGVEIARGLVNYSSQELSAVKGNSTAAIAALLGKRKSYAAIHRDNLVVLVEAR